MRLGRKMLLNIQNPRNGKANNVNVCVLITNANIHKQRINAKENKTLYFFTPRYEWKEKKENIINIKKNPDDKNTSCQTGRKMDKTKKKQKEKTTGKNIY